MELIISYFQETLISWDALIGGAAAVAILLTGVMFVQMYRKPFQRRMYESSFLAWLIFSIVLVTTFFILRWLG